MTKKRREKNNQLKIYFDDKQELKRYLINKSAWEDSEIVRILEHEQAHFDAALSLGYKPRYVVLLNKKTGKPFGTAVDIPDIRPEHRDRIFLAPKNPSYWDIEMAEQHRRTIK